MTPEEFIDKLLDMLFTCDLSVEECAEMVDFAREKLNVPKKESEWP